MALFKKKKNPEEAAAMLAEAGFCEPKKKVKKQSRKEKKQGDIWKYKVKWGLKVSDDSFNNLSQLMNYVASQSDFLAAHKMADTIVAYKVNQDELIDYALEVSLPLTQEVEEVFKKFDMKGHKPFTRLLVDQGPASQQEAARLAEAKEEVVDEFAEQQAFFGQEALARVQEKESAPLKKAPEAPVSNDWGMLGKVSTDAPEEPTEAEKNVTRPWPPVAPVEDKKEEVVEETAKQEQETDEQVTIEVAASADEAPQVVSAEDSVLDSLIKAQFQLSKELDIDKEAILKEELEKKATAGLKKAHAAATVSSKIDLEKAKKAEIKRHEEKMKELEEDAKESLAQEKEDLSKSFAEDAAKDFEEQRVVVQEKHAALLERKEELDNQIEAFKELLG